MIVCLDSSLFYSILFCEHVGLIIVGQHIIGKLTVSYVKFYRSTGILVCLVTLLFVAILLLFQLGQIIV